MKLNKIYISGLRGVKTELNIALEKKSILFYGDNGTGKSTISDALEWFYYDRIDHLADGEIGLKGHNAMRNTALPDNKAGIFRLDISGLDLEPTKVIEVKSGKVTSKISNDNDEIKKYIASSGNENFILRYKNLDDFARSTKSERLTKLSEIIGYSQISKTRDVLKSVCSTLAKEIRTKSFDNQINHQQSQIIEQFGCNITSDEQFIAKVNELVKPFELNKKASSLKDINDILKAIRQPDDSKDANQESFLAKLLEKLVLLPANLDEVEKQYEDYKASFDAIASDADKLKKLILEKLLSTGKEVLEDDGYTLSDCPLCLETKDNKILLASIEERLRELAAVKSERAKLKEFQKSLSDQIESTIKIVEFLLSDRQIKEAENAKHKTNLDNLKIQIQKYQELTKLNPIEGKALASKEKLAIKKDILSSLQENAKKELEEIRKKRASNPKLEAYNQIKIAGNSYASIRKIKSEKLAYEVQLKTMEEIHTEFRKRQSESLQAFLGAFSERINAIYQFLNPNEKIDNIRLAPIEENEELAGITIELDFREEKNVSPPHKYLSESHLNCVGIAFFLSSVEAFNKNNKFIILDDVVSSFDTNHRKRFADLLAEQYDSYQLILLTHENSWFELVRNRIKGKNWLINTIKFSDEDGTYIDEPIKTIQERIVDKIKNNSPDNLGNDARKYLEQILKEIAYGLEVKLPFRFNANNEDRMAYELLTGIKGTLKSKKCNELLNNPVLDRLLNSTFIGNKDSHDGTYQPEMSDLKAFWQDICDFEKIFLCDECDTYISRRYYDSVEKNIRCKDGKVTYPWAE
ncbi:MAG: AAA family ATPase [Alphaproteobacteria bacterium]|nr:AAA family ATPase [Alphaproteobacteria bacterium]